MHKKNYKKLFFRIRTFCHTPKKTTLTEHHSELGHDCSVFKRGNYNLNHGQFRISSITFRSINIGFCRCHLLFPRRVLAIFGSCT